MKKTVLAIILAAVAAALVLTSCGKEEVKGNNDGDVSAEITNITDNTETETAVIYKIKIGGNDISQYSIVLGDKTEETKLIGELLSERIKALAGIEPTVSEDEGEHFIRVNSGEGDTFGVRVENGNMYIVCPTEDGAYAAVASALEESLFDTADAVNTVISVDDGFDVSGKCSDYIIGDNEFNPFD